MKDCIFCKIANKEVESLTLYEDDILMVIMDANPDCDGHTLVIPKKHYTDITEVDNETLMHMFDIARKYADIIMKKLNKSAVTYLINYGDSQLVKHLHLHILPNFKREKPKMSREEVYNILKG